VENDGDASLDLRHTMRVFEPELLNHRRSGRPKEWYSCPTSNRFVASHYSWR